MTPYNSLNAKLSNSQFNKLKSAIKNGTEVTLNLPANLLGSSNDETNFPRKLLLTNTQVSKIRKASANSSSANIKFSKTQLCGMIQSGGFMIETFLSGLLGTPTKKPPEPSEPLILSYTIELVNAATNNKYNNSKEVFVDPGLSLLGKKK